MTRAGSADRLSILLLADRGRRHADNLNEHVASFRRYSRHRVTVFNPRDLPRSRAFDLSGFDVVVLHYSLVITADSYLAPFFRERIRGFRGLKIQFLQDEYRWVDEVTAMLRYLEIDVLFTIVPMREVPKLYGSRIPDAEIHQTLAGFVPESLMRRQRVPPLSGRRFEIGYRGRVLPYWNGRLSQEKVWIAQGVLQRAPTYRLSTDIAWGENDRLYGRRWIEFLESCRTTLAAESGTSITDFDGSIERMTLAYLAEHPGATFDETLRDVLGPYEGNVMMNVISPRVLEAAALRTGLVLFPGEYNGAVEANTHYIPLARDFSNMDEVVDAIRDLPSLQERVDRTHEDVVASGRFSLERAVAEFDDVVDARANRVAARSPGRVREAWAGLERLGVARGSGGRPPRVAVVYGLTRAVMRDRVICRATLAHRRLPQQARIRYPFRRLAVDLWRIDILRRAHGGRSVVFPTFAVVPRVRGDTLVLESSASRNQLAQARRAATPELVDLGRTTLLWDHRPVGLVLAYRLILGRYVGVTVGYYGSVGIHHFGALEELARHRPELVRALLAPFLTPPQRLRRPVAYRVALRLLPRQTAIALIRARRPGAVERLPFPLALVVAPRNYLAKAYLVLRALISDRAVRALVRAAIRERSVLREVGPATIVEDAVKLYVVRSARRGGVGTIARVDAILEGDELRLVSHPTTGAGEVGWSELGHADPVSVRWDNTLVGVSVPYPVFFDRRLSVTVGPDATYRFRTIAALSLTAPGIVRRALA